MAPNRLDDGTEMLKMSRTYFSAFLLSILIIVSTSYIPILGDQSHNEFNNDSEEASGRTCSGPANTDSITILPPGPVTLPADQSRIFNATLYNSGGIPLGGTPDWSVSKGSISPQGGSEAIYYPNLIGNHTVWACAADVTASIQVIVTLGATQSINLSGNKINLSADEVLQLTVTEYDIRGNSGTMFVPSSDWTIPAGSSIHVQPGQAAVWTPGPIGIHTISVTTGGFTSSWEVNVSRGMGIDLVVNVDRTILTSDESVDLTMSIADIRGNLLEVDGNWSTLAPQANAWISGNGSHATFDGTLVGNWTVRAEYNGPASGNTNMSDELILNVRVGRISLISIDGHDLNLKTGEVLQLNPIATDLDGNIIPDATFNWSVDGPSGEQSIDSVNKTFTPSTEGQHNIQVESGGRPSSIRVQVGWSEPIDINVTTTNGDWYLTVVTGGSLPLHVEGLDIMGDWHAYNPSWDVDENFGSIDLSGGAGDYVYNAEGVNWTQLHAFVNDKEYTILVYVTPGPLDHLEVRISDSGVQGESVLFTVRGFDVSGNGVSIPICDLTMTSSAGRTECDEELGWRLYLENDGEQHIVTATYEGSEGTGFIDIQATLLGGQFGSSTDVMAGGAVLIALLISIVLIVVYSRVKKLANEYENELEEEEEEENERAVKELGVPPPPKVTPRRTMITPPSPPPPAFMFGTGIAPNSSSAAPTLGVFVRSDQQYVPGQSGQQPAAQAGWQNAGSTGTAQAPPPVKNWGAPGISGAANEATALQPAPQPNPKAIENKPLSTNDALNALAPTPNENKEHSGEDEPASLSNALSMFSSPDNEENIEPIEQDTPEVIDPPTEDIKQIETEIENVEEPEKSEIESTEDVDSEDKEETFTKEIEWGSWVEDIDDDFESKDIVPGLGPQLDGEILKPLPGTTEGESGWYFDVDGKPALWSFEPIGWEKKD
ncbi:MAG TPA: hypothetical protein EYQ78_05970 [Candidatus Poseidoniales archaeon]|nr:hypothetical protein [Candidatus Poseidoniales archaeon]